MFWRIINWKNRNDNVYGVKWFCWICLPFGGGDTEEDFGLKGYGDALLLFKETLEGYLSQPERGTLAVTVLYCAD